MLRWTLFSCLSFYTQRISTPLSPFTLNVLLPCFRFVSKLIFYYRSFHFYCTTISLATELPLSCPIIDTHSLGLLTIIVGGGVTRTMVRMRTLLYWIWICVLTASRPPHQTTRVECDAFVSLFRMKAKGEGTRTTATNHPHIQRSKN